MVELELFIIQGMTVREGGSAILVIPVLYRTYRKTVKKILETNLTQFQKENSQTVQLVLEAFYLLLANSCSFSMSSSNSALGILVAQRRSYFPISINSVPFSSSS